MSEPKSTGTVTIVKEWQYKAMTCRVNHVINLTPERVAQMGTETGKSSAILSALTKGYYSGVVETNMLIGIDTLNLINIHDSLNYFDGQSDDGYVYGFSCEGIVDSWDVNAVVKEVEHLADEILRVIKEGHHGI